MPRADGQIVIDTKIDTKEAKTQISKFGSALTSFGKTAGRVAIGGLKSASVALTGLGAIGLKYNSEMENYTTNFRVMLGSQEKAVRKVEQLRKMAAKTPFEMTDLADATQTMLSFGIESDKASEYIQELGDISLGNKERFKGLALAFSQVQSAGKLTGQDLLQMINQGFNPLQIISQKTGKSMAELKDEMSKGAISAEDVADAFKIATSEGGKFYKGMDEASKTVSGQISTLKDNAKTLVGEVFEPISKSLLTTLLPTVTDYIGQLSTAFKEKGVEGLTTATGDILASIVTKISESAPQLIDVTSNIVNSLLDGISKNAEKIGTGGAEIISSLVKGISSALPKIADAGIKIVIGLIEGIGKQMPELIPQIIKAVILIATTLIDNIDKVIDAGIQLIFGLAEGLIQALPTLIEKAPIIVSKLVEKIVENAPKLLVAAVKLMLKLAQGIFENLPKMATAANDIISALVKGIQDLGWKVIDIGKNIVRGIWDGIKSMANWLGNKVKGFFNDLWEKAKDTLEIHSPSKKFAWIGKMSAKGVGVGFTEEMKNVTKDIQNALPTKFNLNNAVNAGMGAIKAGTAITQNVTIISPKHLSAYETATQNQLMLQRALWGV